MLIFLSGVSAEGSGVVVEGSASFPEEAIATPPAAADEDEDSDVDLFGEETEEEKKGAEERAAAVKASGKKKECKAKFVFSILCFKCKIDSVLDCVISWEVFGVVGCEALG
uniref:Translation elongation factor EF1B beta/delta subunit guanine nucleotide exchange domain-containing protein n=1 Tax=Lactuca sativa TaxID=4236 RepID=A0A9R1X0S2_LACSA|nr:hypothetical protein LSAT_V11C800435510 [Lactuca sativa]